MRSSNRLYATYFSAAAQVGGADEGVHTGCDQAQKAQWLEKDHGGLEVDHDRAAGIEVRYPSGIETDESRRPRWVELDPEAPPSIVPFLNEARPADTGSERGTEASGPQRIRVCGPSRKWFWILVALLAAGIVGGGVGGGIRVALGHHTAAESSEIPSNTTKSSPILQNSSIAATQWGDGSGNKVYRVYVQSTEGPILEATWELKNPTWKISKITDEYTDIKLGTPIAAAVRYSYDNDTLAIERRSALAQSPGDPSYPKRVYFVGQAGTLYEHASPYKHQESLWGGGRLGGGYAVSSDSFVFSFWYQNSTLRTQILAVLFQNSRENSLSVAKYMTNRTGTTRWKGTTPSLQIQDGSALAVAPIGDRRDLRMYASDTGGKMTVHRYNLTRSSLGDPFLTSFDISPRAPISVSTQDNRNYFTAKTLPECAKEDGQPLTHLIMFPTLDRRGLNLVSWNCSSGFLNQTTTIEPLLQENRTYLGIANTITSLNPEDQRVYVLFDAGDGPEIEEWQVPPGAQNADWRVLGIVPVAFR
ncbi:hypothetical protein GGR58DRAFT_502728 [Xylaria digitata]|nr:hypothetical protein GGR58DRAFT_502728 [Xylaria digitata]